MIEVFKKFKKTHFLIKKLSINLYFYICGKFFRFSWSLKCFKTPWKYFQVHEKLIKVKKIVFLFSSSTELKSFDFFSHAHSPIVTKALSVRKKSGKISSFHFTQRQIFSNSHSIARKVTLKWEKIQKTLGLFWNWERILYLFC